MLVGIDITSLAAGRGPARYTTEIVRAISRCCAKDDQFILYSPFEKQIDALPVNFIHRLVPIKRFVPWLNWSLPHQAKKDKIEVMFFPANDFWIFSYIKSIVTLHDIAPATMLSAYHHTLLDKLQNKIQLYALKHIVSNVITVSKYSSIQIKNNTSIHSDKIRVIYNGVSSRYCNRVQQTKRRGFILYVGGFDRRKNLVRLLKAYKCLTNRGTKEKLVLAGNGGGNLKLYYNIEQLVEETGLKGFVEIIVEPTDERLVDLYTNARLLVQPSLIEGFGLTVLEAMACGCPVACSNAASLPEVGGDAVVYFNPYDVRDMTDVIQRVLNDEGLSREMIEKGYIQADKFSWTKAGEEVYKTLHNAYADGN